MKRPPYLALCAVLAAVTCIVGLDWGLPRAERAGLVLGADQASPAFYAALAENRGKLYARIGGRAMGFFKKSFTTGERLYDETWAVGPEHLLHSYSSYLVRSTDPDEQMTLTALAQMKPRKLDFNPRYFAYGGAYIYAVGGALALGKVLGLVRLIPDITHYYAAPGDSAALYLAGRALSALAGIFVVLMLFRLTRRLTGDERWAAFAAGLGALAPAILSQAHLMKPHIVGTLLCLLCAERALDIAELGKKKDWKPYLLAGAFAGAAMGVMLGFYLLGVLLVAVAHLTPRRFSPKALADPRPWAAGLVMAAVFVSFNPYMILDYANWHNEIVGYQLQARKFTWNPVLTLQYLHYAVTPGLGKLLCAAAFFGSAGLLWKGKTPERVLAGPTLSFLVYLAMQLGDDFVIVSEFVRYFLPGAALFIVLAAASLHKLSAFERWRPAALALAAAIALGTGVRGARYTLNFALDRPGTGNAYRAGAWINANVPKGAEIGILDPMPHLYNEPPFRFGDYALFNLWPMRFDGAPAGGELPEYAVLGKNYSALMRSSAAENEAFLTRNGYALVEEFSGSGPLRAFRNHMTTANLPFQVWRRAKR